MRRGQRLGVAGGPGCRLGLWRPKPDGWGALRLTTTGRRTECGEGLVPGGPLIRRFPGRLETDRVIGMVVPYISR